MLREIPLCMMLSFTIWAQQIDKTSPAQDLADQRDAARTERAGKLNVIQGAEKILRDKLGPDVGDDPGAEAPFIHLRLMACLVKGDYSRRVSKIYAHAADAANIVAKELDAKAGVSTASSTEATEARQNLDDAIRRDAELRAKATLNGVEKAEMDGLPAFENQLRETIAIYERIENSHSPDAPSGDMSRQMRQKEALLRMKAKQADANTQFYNAQCADELSQLRWIDQAQRAGRLLHEYDRLANGQAAPDVPADKGWNSAVPAPAKDDPSDAEKLKEDERILSDPDELLKRANRLKQLSGQGKSN
jgi:hypothetical protein